MTNKTYKDLKATGILLGIITFMVTIFLFAKYATSDVKEIVARVIFSCLFLGLIFAFWKVIRLLID